MRHPLVLLVAGGAALAACSEEPSLYPGGPPGAAARLKLSTSAATVVVGDSVNVGARAEDAVGNTTGAAPTFSSCDQSIVAVGSTVQNPAPFTGAVWLRGVALGSSCAVVSAGGQSDTVRVVTSPFAVRILPTDTALTKAGPDTLFSGDTTNFLIQVVDRAGTVLSGSTDYRWESSRDDRLSILATTGEANAKTAGAVAVRVRAPNGSMDTKTFTVIPRRFKGTMPAATAGPGALVKVARAPGGHPWDRDTQVFFGGLAAFVDAFTPDTLTFALPATGSTALGVLSLRQIGPMQVQNDTNFTSTIASTDIYSPGNVNSANCGGAVAGAPEFFTAASPGGNVYFTHSGTTGTASSVRGRCNGGTQADHYFRLTTGPNGAVIHMDLAWTATSPTATDVDIIVYTLGFGFVGGGFSGSGSTETVRNLALAPNTTYQIVVSPFTVGAARTNFRLNVRHAIP